MTPTRKLALTAVAFALALVCVVIAAATHAVAPLFFAWLPLIALVWVHTRLEPGELEEPAKPLTFAPAPDESDQLPER